MTEFRTLYETVIKNGYCIGCGACVTVSNSPFKITMNEYGNFVVTVQQEEALVLSDAKVLHVCPFSGKSKNENELGQLFFPDNEVQDQNLGKYLNCYAGYVNESEFRKKGSSGGFGKWIGYKLLQEKHVDYFIQLAPNQTNSAKDLLFDYKIYTHSNEVILGSKSSYYPSNLVNVIQHIKSQDGKYAITGVPCFIKTLRLLALHDKILKERIVYTIGIVCGGMKSANHAKMIGWELGVHPDNLIGIDFRRKYKDRPASQKIYQVWSSADKKERFRNANDLFATDYGAGFFKPKACDYCDDVVAETADISIGDAWLPGFREDPEGSSLLIVRNKHLQELIIDAQKNDTIKIKTISAEEAVNSQAGGYRHRREGLSLRLKEQEIGNNWYPQKRFVPNQFTISSQREKIYKMRTLIAAKSHSAFHKALQQDSLPLFFSEMKSLNKAYKRMNTPSFGKRLKGSILRRLKLLVP
jgi:coenzyme F420-reducing hydrogenase beta subunit